MKYLSIDEQSRLVKTVTEIKAADRDAVIIRLLLNTGLRVSELAGLVVGDVRNKDRLWVRPEIAKRMRRVKADGKPRAKGRFVPLMVDTQDMLHVWISMKLKQGESIESTAPLFVSRLGTAISKRALQFMVEKWMVKAGLTCGEGDALFSVHSLRHTFAIRFLERNGHMDKALTRLKKVLGHESLSSTGVYTEASDEQVAEAMNNMSLSQTRAKRRIGAV